jgi:hypothetical protein
MSSLHFHAHGRAVTTTPANLHAAIERLYVDDPDGGWLEISVEEFLRRTEWAGYWVMGTALEAIKAAGQIRTPWAIFRLRAEVKA